MAHDKHESNGQDKTPQKAAKRTKKTVDLATAKVADGAIKSPRSVYEMVGISTTSYATAVYAEYQEHLRSLTLMQLQDEAYHRGTPATDSRDTIIDRLERKFLQENSRYGTNGATKKTTTPEEDLRRQAQNILNRGR